MSNDAADVARALEGHEDAWRLLYDRHVNVLFRLAWRTVGDRETALDVEHDPAIQRAEDRTFQRGAGRRRVSG